MAFRRGDVWLVNYPFSDLSSSKVRPAAICSTDDYHAEQPDLIVVPLTSNIDSTVGTLDYALQDWHEAGLKKATALKPAIAAIDVSLTVHRIGALSQRDLDEIETRLRLSIGH